MGFGLLFVGYLMTFLLYLAGGYGCYSAIIGCLIMLYASTKLIDYEPRFRYVFFSAIPLALSVAFELSGAVSGLFGATLPGFLGSELAANIVKYAKFVFDFGFHIALSFAVASIAGNTGVEKAQRAAWRNLIFYAIYFVVAVVASCLPGSLPAAPYILKAQLMFYFVWLVFYSIMLFSCYMRICDEGDQDMKAKPSRFEAVNRWREEYDRREARANERQREYREQKLKKRAEQLKKNQNHKKKKK